MKNLFKPVKNQRKKNKNKSKFIDKKSFDLFK